MKKNLNAESAKKKIKLPIWAYLIYFLTALFLLTGVTFSKYVVGTNENDSARAVTFEDIAVSEIGDFFENGKLLLQPGVDLEKKAVVNFGGSETATYVFIAVNPAGWTVGSDNYGYTVQDGKISYSIDNSLWTYLMNDDEKYIYYIPLNVNEKLTNADIIKDGKVFVNDMLKNSELQSLTELTVEFRAVAVQSAGFENAQDAWKAVSTK